jgi:hypothetical protein
VNFGKIRKGDKTMTVFKGNTSGGQEIAKTQRAEDAPFLPATFFQPGDKYTFRVLSSHKSSNGPYISVQLLTPQFVKIEDKSQMFVRIGNLAGITFARMQALAGAKVKYFLPGDKVFLQCTGITPPEQPGHSPSPNFELEIDREEVQPEDAKKESK